MDSTFISFFSFFLSFFLLFETFTEFGSLFTSGPVNPKLESNVDVDPISTHVHLHWHKKKMVILVQNYD